MSTSIGIPVRVLKAHLALNVKSVESSIDFYRQLFGIEPSKVRSRYAKFDVENPPLNFTLNEGIVGSHGVLSHLGMQVASTDDVIAMRDRLLGKGLDVREEMGTVCCYARQDKAWVHDPDGNEWEVFVVLEDNLAESGICCNPEDNVNAGVGEQESVAAGCDCGGGC